MIKVLHFFEKLLFLLRLSKHRRSFMGTTPEGVLQLGESPLLLVTVAFNACEVLELHLALTRHMLTDDYIHVVLENSTSSECRAVNKKICERYRAIWIPLPPNPWSGRDPSQSHALALNWSVQHVLPFFGGQYVGFLDHDIFPIIRHSILENMCGKRLMGIVQHRPNMWYLWPGFAFFQKSIFSSIHLDFSPIKGADTGGALWPLLYAQTKQQDAQLFSFDEKIFCKENMEALPYWCTEHWVHTVNASSWRAGAPPAAGIRAMLQEITGLKILD